MSNIRLGVAICGSYCSYSKFLPELKRLAGLYVGITPIMSENSYETDTRFGAAGDFIAQVEEICGRKVIKSITEAESIGPKALFDILAVAPCTGNTIAKLANGVTDTSVTMACKAHLRNNRPLVLAVTTNDGLSGNAANIGTLMARKNIYFVPYYQDDPENKPSSINADFSLLADTIKMALDGKQLQPVLRVNVII